MTPAALREVYSLQSQIDNLLNQKVITRSDQKRVDLLISRIATLRGTGLSSLEARQTVANEMAKEFGLPTTKFDETAPEQRAHNELFRDFLSGKPDSLLEQRGITHSTFLAGGETPIFSSGEEGGVLVPFSFAQKVAEARALVDPLFDENVVTLIQEPTFKLPPLQIPGWDLTGVAAVKTTEATQKGTDVIPDVSGTLTNRWTYRATLTGSFEYDQDAKAYGSAEAALARAFGIAFGRGISADLVVGDGSTGPQGALTGAVDSGVTTASAGFIKLGDVNDIFYSLNPEYRNSPKCFWVVSDSTHKMLSNATDNADRPLLNVANGIETLKGKPVLISPSMPSAAGSKGILFGDFSHYYVHASSLFIRRRLQYPGLVEYGKVAYTGLQMADAIVNDPTDGANSGEYSPIKYATLAA